MRVIVRLGLLLAAVSVAACRSSPAEAQSGAPPRTEPGVFAISPVYTVMPNGAVGELRGSPVRDLHARSGYFDAGRQTITLFGARNQEVAAQIVVPRTGTRFAARASAVGDVPVERVTFSAIGWNAVDAGGGDSTRASTRNLPDVVIPLDGTVGGLTTFDVPLAVDGVPRVQNAQGLLLMEVWIPRAARAGLHRGTVEILQNGAAIATLGVELVVSPIVLPDRPTFRLDYLSYGSPLRHLNLDAAMGDGGSGAIDLSARAQAVEGQAHALALDNRGFLNVLPYASQRGTPSYGYPVRGVGKTASVVSFDSFDRRFGPLLDGAIGKYRTPPAVFQLPFNLNYPVAMRSDPSAQFDWRPFARSMPEAPGLDPRLRDVEDTWRAVAQHTLSHIARRGWTNTAFEIFNNQKPASNNTSPWNLDEPVDTQDFQALRYFLSLAKWAFAGAESRRVQVVTRVDVGHWECDKLRTSTGEIAGCYKAKDFGRAKARTLLQPVLDRWVVGHVHAHGARNELGEYAAAGAVVDEYGGAAVVATHAGELAGLAWVARRLGLQGRVVFHAGYADPRRVQGDAAFYTGAGMGFTGVLASRRVKLWRDAVNDYEVLLLAERADRAAADAVVSAMTNTGVTADPSYRRRSRTAETFVSANVEDLLRARRIVLALAAGQDRSPAVALEGFRPNYAQVGTPDTIVGFD